MTKQQYQRLWRFAAANRDKANSKAAKDKPAAIILMDLYREQYGPEDLQTDSPEEGRAIMACIMNGLAFGAMSV